MDDGPATTFGLVIPTHGRPALVTEAVRSARAQTRPFDRVVVVCDGLQPDAEAALHGEDCEVVTIPRSGVSAARNAGIETLDTEWVVFLDDDDLLHPDYLATMAARLRARPDAQAMNAHFIVIEEDAADALPATADPTALRTLFSAHAPHELEYMSIYGSSFDRLLERMRGSLSGSAVRRETLRRAGGFPEDLRCAEDWSMYVNVARLTEWDTVDDSLVISRIHSGTRGTTHGGVRNGIDTLRAAASFWQPSSLPTPPHRPLAAYREHYRFVLRWTLELARRDRDRAAFREGMRTARTILPWRDRQLARIPTSVWNAGRRLGRPASWREAEARSDRRREVRT